MTTKINSVVLTISPNRVFFVLFAVFLVFINPAQGQEVTAVGNSCTEKNKLPQSFLCSDGLVVDCRSSTNSREQLYCAASELQKADSELNRLYQRVLKKLEKPNDEYADYQNARRALIEGQRAWVRFKKSNCEVAGYLNLKGNIQSNEVIGCELKHTKNRIADLAAYFMP